MNFITRLSSVIEAAVAAGVERYIGESLDVRIEREVDAALKKRFASPHRHSNTQSSLNVPSSPGVEPVGEAGPICQPTISTTPSNRHSRHVPEASPADSVRPAAPEWERRAAFIKPTGWNIIDVTDLFDEPSGESLDVASSMGHGIADTSDSLVPDDRGNETDNTACKVAPEDEAAASGIRADWIQEAPTSAHKRSFEEIVQRAPIADVDVDSPQKRRLFELDKAASEGVDSYNSKETALATPPIKTARKKPNPQGYTTGPPIRFLKVCSQLTAAPNRRGWPRVVDLNDLMHESNMQNLTMADIVATVFWNHGPKTLEAFLDFEGRPEFLFNRWENDDITKDIWIIRYLAGKGVIMVACGPRSRDNSLERSWATMTEASFTCRVAGNGRWDIVPKGGPFPQTLQSSVVKFGTKLFFDEVWKESKSADITIR